MGVAKEIELALALRRREQRLLRDRLGPPMSTARQHTVYFDCKAWRREGFSVRIRRLASRLVLTLKLGRDRAGDWSVCTEVTVPVPRAEWDALRAGRAPIAPHLHRLLQRFRVMLPRGLEPRELRALPGTATTIRRKYRYLGLTLELDETRLPTGRVYYDLEVEVGDKAELEDAQEKLQGLLRELEIPWRPRKQSKRYRFRQELRRWMEALEITPELLHRSPEIAQRVVP